MFQRQDFQKVVEEKRNRVEKYYTGSKLCRQTGKNTLCCVQKYTLLCAKKLGASLHEATCTCQGAKPNCVHEVITHIFA